MAIQLVPNNADCTRWGQFVRLYRSRGYQTVWGTGVNPESPFSRELNTEGSLNFSMSLDKDQFELAYPHDPLKRPPQTLWSQTEQFSNFGVHLYGIKFRRGFLGQFWVGALALELRDTADFPKLQERVGFLGAKKMEVLFGQFDRWLAGRFNLSLDIMATLEFG
jgi:hypothetical protein